MIGTEEPLKTLRKWREMRTRLAARAKPVSPGPVSAWTRGLRVAGAGLTALLLVLVAFFNHESRDRNIEIRELPIEVERFVRATHIAQHWFIFTDLDERPNGWYLALGQREDGEIVNLIDETVFRGLERPERPAAFFVNHNMRRLWHLAALDRYRGLRPLLGDWLVRDWNRRHEQQVERVILFMLEGTGEPGTVPPMMPVAERAAEGADQGKAAWRPFLEEITARILAGPPQAAAQARG